MGEAVNVANCAREDRLPAVAAHAITPIVTSEPYPDLCIHPGDTAPSQTDGMIRLANGGQ
jgi:hypothetical protein